MTTHDYEIQNAGGRTVRMDFNNALMALATCNASLTEPVDPYAGMLWLDTSVLPSGIVRQRNQANTQWVAMSGMPAEATDSQVATGTDDTTFVTPAGYQERLDAIPDWRAYNCVVNGAMRVSQENGDNVVTFGPTPLTAYIADQWAATLSTAATAAAINAQRVASLTPRKSTYRLRITVTTAKAVLAAGDYLSFWQRIEGIRLVNFGWGTAAAKQVIVRFGFKGPAGIYHFGLRTAGSPYRAYCAPFTISAAQANTDTEQTFVIPGDTSGTWPTGSTGSVDIWITMAAGATYQSVSGWQNGNFIGSTGMSNGLAATGRVYELFDVGFYIDPRRAAVAPRWSLPTIEEELATCQRYFVADCRLMFSGGITTALVYYALGAVPVDMRIAPAVQSPASAAANAFPAAAGTISVIAPATGRVKMRENRTSSATGTGLWVTSFNLSARM